MKFLGYLMSVALLPVMVAGAAAETLSGALARAYTANPDLNQQRAAVRATDETVPQASAAGRPTVTATSQFGYNYFDLRTSRIAGATGSPLPVDGTRLRRGTDPGSPGLTVTQNVFNGNRTVNGVSQAESNILSAREILRNTEQNVLFGAVSAYMNVLRDTAILDLRKNNIVVLEEQLRQTRDRFTAGEVTRTDVAEAEASLATGRSDYFTAQANSKASVADFRRVVGVEPSRLEPAQSIESLLPRKLGAAVNLALSEHPAVEAALHAVDAAALQVKLVEGRLYPSVNLIANIQKNYNYAGIPGERFLNGSIAVQLSLPIYEGGADYSEARQAKEALGQAMLQVDLQRDLVRSSVVSTWGQLEAARAVIESSKAAVRAAEIALDGVRQEAEVGQRTTFDILFQQQVLLNARIGLVTARHDRVVVSYAVMAAIGRLSAVNLHLAVTQYDPKIHFNQVKDKWIGLSTLDGR